jgi:hypothetical protein
MTAPLIALYSPAPASGKTTLAEALWQHGYQPLKLAGPLKRMTAALLREIGYSAECIRDALEGSTKTTPIPELGDRTPRHLMQTLGTEWGRVCVADDLWLSLTIRHAQALRTSGVPVVIDDMRFPNEAAALRAAGATLIRIDRPHTTNPDTHASEGALDTWPFDLTITNDAPDAATFAAHASRLADTLARKEPA